MRIVGSVSEEMGRTGEGSGEGLPASAVFSNSFSLKYHNMPSCRILGAVCS